MDILEQVSYCLSTLLNSFVDVLLSSYKWTLLFVVVYKAVRFVFWVTGLPLPSVARGPRALESLDVRGDTFLLAEQINRDTTGQHVTREWFSVRDLVHRSGVAVFAFMVAIVTAPCDFMIYTYHYMRINTRRPLLAVSAVIFLPLWPVVMAIETIFAKILNKDSVFFDMEDEDTDETIDEEDTGLQFFTDDLPLVAGTVFKFYQSFAYYMANFYIVGTHLDGIQVTYWDTAHTDKLFWRSVLAGVGAKIPKSVALWRDNTAKIEDRTAIDEAEEVLIKVTDSCLGIGDKFAVRGKDYESTEDLTKILKENYQGKTCVVMEVVKPLPRLGVHSLDILTARDPNGHVQLLDVMVWTNTTTKSTHSASECYMLDVEDGTAVASGRWYCPAYRNAPTPGLGTTYPELHRAIDIAVRAHAATPYPWATTVGFDAMVVPGDEGFVFFEGNIATSRLQRRIFFSFTNFLYYIQYLRCF